MKKLRIIPRLDIKGQNVVKPVHTEALRVVGNPVEMAREYYLAGADELIYLDIVASLYQRNLDFELLRSVAKEIFIPLTVGGGIRSIHDINNALRAGADKVAINTYAVQNPSFLAEAVKNFGSQCIVLYVEAKKIGENKWEPYTDGGRERTRKDVIEWVKKGIEEGVGEILITAIDYDGTRKGFDLELIKAITSFSPIPVIAHGGAGNIDSVYEAFTDAKVDAVGVSSILHYHDVKIGAIKKELAKRGLTIRV